MLPCPARVRVLRTGQQGQKKNAAACEDAWLQRPTRFRAPTRHAELEGPQVWAALAGTHQAHGRKASRPDWAGISMLTAPAERAASGRRRRARCWRVQRGSAAAALAPHRGAPRRRSPHARPACPPAHAHRRHARPQSRHAADTQSGKPTLEQAALTSDTSTVDSGRGAHASTLCQCGPSAT